MKPGSDEHSHQKKEHREADEIKERFHVHDSSAIDVEAERRCREQRHTVKWREKFSEDPKQTKQQNNREIDVERPRFFEELRVVHSISINERKKKWIERHSVAIALERITAEPHLFRIFQIRRLIAAHRREQHFPRRHVCLQCIDHQNRHDR